MSTKNLYQDVNGSFIYNKQQKQLKCSSTSKWITNLCHIKMMEFGKKKKSIYTGNKMNESLKPYVGERRHKTCIFYYYIYMTFEKAKADQKPDH